VWLLLKKHLRSISSLIAAADYRIEDVPAGYPEIDPLSGVNSLSVGWLCCFTDARLFINRLLKAFNLDNSCCLLQLSSAICWYDLKLPDKRKREKTVKLRGLKDAFVQVCLCLSTGVVLNGVVQYQLLSPLG